MSTVIRGSDNFDTADNATQTELDNVLSNLPDSTAPVGKTVGVHMPFQYSEINTKEDFELYKNTYEENDQGESVSRI